MNSAYSMEYINVPMIYTYNTFTNILGMQDIYTLTCIFYDVCLYIYICIDIDPYICITYVYMHIWHGIALSNYLRTSVDFIFLITPGGGGSCYEARLWGHLNDGTKWTTVEKYPSFSCPVHNHFWVYQNVLQNVHDFLDNSEWFLQTSSWKSDKLE